MNNCHNSRTDPFTSPRGNEPVDQAGRASLSPGPRFRWLVFRTGWSPGTKPGG